MNIRTSAERRDLGLVEKPKIWMILIRYTSFYVYGVWAQFSTKEKKSHRILANEYFTRPIVSHLQLLIDVTRTNKAQLKWSSIYLENWSLINNLFSWHFYLVNTFYLSYKKAEPHSLTD